MSTKVLGLGLEIILAIVAGCLLVTMLLAIYIVFVCRQRQQERLRQQHRAKLEAKYVNTETEMSFWRNFNTDRTESCENDNF